MYIIWTKDLSMMHLVSLSTITCERYIPRGYPKYCILMPCMEYYTWYVLYQIVDVFQPILTPSVLLQQSNKSKDTMAQFSEQQILCSTKYAVGNLSHRQVLWQTSKVAGSQTKIQVRYKIHFRPTFNKGTRAVPMHLSQAFAYCKLSF